MLAASTLNSPTNILPCHSPAIVFSLFRRASEYQYAKYINMEGFASPRAISPQLRSPRGESASGNEFLTRRFVEKAASNRLLVLHRKLQASQRPIPWMVSPRSKTHSEACTWRPLTPEPRYRAEGAYYISTPSRSMSASPLRGSSYTSPMRSPAKQRKALLPHHMHNDFIQLPLSGTYRHMDQLYGSGKERFKKRILHTED